MELTTVEAKSESVVHGVIGQQNHCIGSLTQALGELFARLQPVRLTAPKDKTAKERCDDKANECVIVEALQNHNCRLSALQQSVVDVIGELQI